jgi:NDP-sugar pyrophosphorylase family protein
VNRKSKIITPIIFVGGLGTRLRPIIGDKPKALAQVNGRPFLSYILEQLEDMKFNYIILCTGYKAYLIKREFGSAYKGINIQYSEEPAPLGTGGALRKALSLVHTDFILAMNGDSYIDFDLNSYIDWHYTNKMEASLLLSEVQDTRRFGYVQINKNSKILEFIEKPKLQASGWINAGIYLFKKRLLEIIPSGIFFSLEKELFPKLAGKNIHGYRCNGKFIEIGTPQSYNSANKFFLKKNL